MIDLITYKVRWGMNLWDGRFKEATNSLVKKFTSSISIDKKLYSYDIQGSIAHVKMLAKCKIVAKDEAERIIKALNSIDEDIKKGEINLTEKEDIHMAIEEELIKREGKTGERLHTARSRNDQIALDERLYLREKIEDIENLILKFQRTLLKLAEENKAVILPGYTHLQYAQPLFFSHYILAYFWMIQRDKDRFKDCYKRVNIMPLGAGALAGTSLPIDRDYVAELLKFPRITENSVDTVSDRDYIIEALACLCLLMMHLSRLCEDLILFSSPAFFFIEISDAFTTGSSLMPQKKNPDVLELIRGKTGKVYGFLFSFLITMKALPLSYNKDMQEDKFALFQSIEEVEKSLKICILILNNLNINKEQMEEKAKEGFFAATDLVEYLVEKGAPFRGAHQIVGKIVRYCLEKEKKFQDLTIKEYQSFSPLFEAKVKQRTILKRCVENKESSGGTGRKSVEKQIKLAKEILEK